MKRLYIGIGLLLFFLIAGILLTFCFCRIHAPLAETMEEASRQALNGNWENAISLAQSARERWETYRNFTAAVADHEPLEEMDMLFSQLDIYAKLRLSVEFADICTRLSQMAAAMEESQAFTWWTLL